MGEFSIKIKFVRLMIFFLPLLALLMGASSSPTANAITFPADAPPPVIIKKKTPLDKPLSLPVNINTADAKTLMQVPGINRTAARQIVNYRDRNGKYTGLDQLVGFSGISNSSIHQLDKYLSVQ